MPVSGTKTSLLIPPGLLAVGVGDGRIFLMRIPGGASLETLLCAEKHCAE